LMLPMQKQKVVAVPPPGTSTFTLAMAVPAVKGMAPVALGFQHMVLNMVQGIMPLPPAGMLAQYSVPAIVTTETRMLDVAPAMFTIRPVPLVGAVSTGLGA